MIKFILLLILPFCSGSGFETPKYIIKVDKIKPTSYDEYKLSSTLGTTKEIYCSDNYVAHCYTYNVPVEYFPGDLQGIGISSAATVFQHSACTDKVPEEQTIAYVFMSSCQALLRGIKLKDKEIEAKLYSGFYQYCSSNGPCASPNLMQRLTEVATTNWKNINSGDSMVQVVRSRPMPTVDRTVAERRLPAATSSCQHAFSCKDCRVGRICAPTLDGRSLYEVNTFQCTGEHPYCNSASGTCSSSPDPDCGPVQRPNPAPVNFICMRDGLYPDPFDCSAYFSCQGKVVIRYVCSFPFPYYHPAYKRCVAKRDYCTSDTTTKYCKDQRYTGKKLPIAHTRNYFMLCGGDNLIVVDRCIGRYTFDARAQMCGFSCPSEGLFMKHDDCTKYFKCSPKHNGGYVLSEKSCPEGEGFLESEYMCFPRGMVPNCRLSLSDLFSK